MKKVYLNTLKPEEIIKRMKNGEVVKQIDSETKIRMIDGVIVISYKDGDFTIGFYFLINEANDYYFEEEEEEFEITETGLYKTRDGRKVFVSSFRDVDCYPVCGVIEGNDGTGVWTRNGLVNTHDKSQIDIVSKWNVD